MSDSRVSTRAPLRILCQADHGSCGACCGVYNFVDRGPAATRARLQRRTTLVTAAWPDEAALAAARDVLLAEEKPSLLFAAVKVCPFAGLVDGVDSDRVGCLLHPTRHPDGADLRDLAVYPKEVCAGHFCASHDWLRDREVAIAQTARGPLYGRVVTDAGLVKAVARVVDDERGGAFVAKDVEGAADAFAGLWVLLLERWPFADPDPRRFGGFFFDGDEARERSIPSCLFGVSVDVSGAERQILDAIGTRPLDDDAAQGALKTLRAAIAGVVAALAAR